MNVIDNIDDLDKAIRTDKFFLLNYNISLNMLEYYVNNYNEVDWLRIAIYQMLTEEFIEKYKENINFANLFRNSKSHLSFNFIESHLYRFNIFDATVILANKQTYIEDLTLIDTNMLNILDKLIIKYPVKYEIDRLSYVLNNQ